MKTISSFRELGEFGIDALTGEVCGYGYRMLCDLTERGIKIVAASMGINDSLFRNSLPDAWNSKGVRSIMLAPQMLTPLAVFALFDYGCTVVYIMYDGSVVGIQSTDKPEIVEQWLGWNQGKLCEECNRYGKGGGVKFQYRNPGWSRNTHAMSGRTV